MPSIEECRSVIYDGFMHRKRLHVQTLYTRGVEQRRVFQRVRKLTYLLLLASQRLKCMERAH